MKRFIIITLLAVLLITLSACQDPSIDRLKISLNPSVDTIEVNTTYIDEGAKASYGFRTLDVQVVMDEVDTTKPGVYEIIYKAVYLDFEKTITRYVTVIDSNLLNIFLNEGVDTIFVGETWMDSGISSDQDVHVEVIGSVDVLSPGEYIITYRINDGEILLRRYVNVIEMNE